VVSGVLESASNCANIGVIRDVGVFAGNQPPVPFAGFGAAFEHYTVYPVDLVATAGNDQVALAWDAATWADGYRIYRSPTKDGPFHRLGVTTGTSFVDRDLEGGATRYYMVVAYDDGPSVGYSPRVKVVP
jgi:hypothetical protein